MKAKELMIGDLVRIIEPDRYHGAICRIVSLINHKDDECAYFKVFILTKGNLLHEVCNEDIKPIQLTSAILEKNGFNRHGCVSENEQYQVMIQHWSEDNLALNKVGKHGNPVFIPDLIYVHELQHALRLCGLNDLADNFKI